MRLTRSARPHGRRGGRVTAAVVVVILVSASAVSASPVGAKAAARDRRLVDVLLVTGHDTNDITPIDLSVDPPVTGSYLDLPLDRPSGLAVLGNRTALVVAEGSRNLSVVDLTGPDLQYTGRVAFPPSSGTPGPLAVSPDEKVGLVAFGYDAPIMPVDLTKDPPVVGKGVKLDRTYQPGGMAIAPDGKTALVTISNSDKIVPLDLTTDPPTPGPAIGLGKGKGPGAVAITSDGRRAVVTNFQFAGDGYNHDGRGNATLLDLTKTPIQPIANIGLGTTMPFRVIISHDDETAYVANLYSNSVTPISLDDGKFVARPAIGLNGGRYPVSLAVTADGKQLVVGNGFTNNITPVDLSVTPPRPGVPVRTRTDPYGLAIVRLPMDGARTTTRLTSKVNPSVYTQSPVVTATVSGAEGGTPYGEVVFTVDGAARPPVALEDGVATLELDRPTAGGHRIRARFVGSMDFRPSDDTIVQSVNPAATVTRVTSSVNPAVHGQPVSASATVSAVGPASGIPGGKVTFKIDGKAIGDPITLVKGRATVSAPFRVGTQELTASFSGPSYKDSSDTLTGGQVVRPAATSVSIESSGGDSPEAGDPITVHASVVAIRPGAGQPGGTVSFFVDDAPNGPPIRLESGVAAHTLELTAGHHVVSARYSGSDDFASSSGSLDQDVRGG